MTVEIRELIIRTEIRSQGKTKALRADSEVLKTFKKQIMEEWKRMLKYQSSRNGLNR